ncbi:unnamed protein product [Ilex paraguariensis]|uniref:Uncharacterized protein n=1 Tax=Ilex paraguariensis TaxID=185542 RepID=A0ABC8TEJ6_9AQUA
MKVVVEKSADAREPKEDKGVLIWQPWLKARGWDIIGRDTILDDLDIVVGVARVVIISPNLCISEDDDSLARSALQLMVVQVDDLGASVVKKYKDMRTSFLSNSLVVENFGRLESECVKVTEEYAWLQANLFKITEKGEELDKKLKEAKQAYNTTREEKVQLNEQYASL